MVPVKVFQIPSMSNPVLVQPPIQTIGSGVMYQSPPSRGPGATFVINNQQHFPTASLNQRITTTSSIAAQSGLV